MTRPDKMMFLAKLYSCLFQVTCVRAFWPRVLRGPVRTEARVVNPRILEVSLAPVLSVGKVRVCPVCVLRSLHIIETFITLTSVIFTGQTCEVDINECVRNPCTNGGVCENLRGGFQCHCNPGFTGDLCETDNDDCTPSKKHRKNVNEYNNAYSQYKC